MDLIIDFNWQKKSSENFAIQIIHFEEEDKKNGKKWYK